MTDSDTDDRPCCPACTTAEMVSRYAGPEAWICYGCSRTFDTEIRHGGHTMSEAEGVPPVPEAITDAAPSRKLIVWAFLLSDADRLTQEELRGLTGLSLGAVSHSLRDLRDAGLVEKHPDPNNPVGHQYELQIARS